MQENLFIDDVNNNIKLFQKRIFIVMLVLFFCNALVNEYCNGDLLTIAIWVLFVFELYEYDAVL